MNPFDLPGEEFLLFYLALIVVVLSAAVLIRRRNESTLTGDLSPVKQGLVVGHTHPSDARAAMSDPYLIAALRGGNNEVIRTAVVSLVDRGLLTVDGDSVVASAIGFTATVRKQVERAILDDCRTKQAASDLFTSDHVIAGCSE